MKEVMQRHSLTTSYRETNAQAVSKQQPPYKTTPNTSFSSTTTAVRTLLFLSHVHSPL